MPIVEEGLEQLVADGLRHGRLRFVVGAAAAVAGAEFVYLCVPTPQAADGAADLSFVESVAAEIGPLLASESIVVNKSTVPVGSTRIVQRACAGPTSSSCRTPSSSGRAPRSTTSSTPGGS